MDVDFNQEKEEVFQQAWTYLNDNFFDSEFNGVNWKAMHDRFAPHIAAARTPSDVRRLTLLMIGELNSSHSGINAPVANADGGRGGRGGTVGKLGLQFDAGEYAGSGHLRIAGVLPLGPAEVAGGVKPGSYLLAVDGAPVGEHTNLDELLEHKVNQKVELTVADSADGAGKHDVAVRPSGGAAEKELLYRDWVDRQRAYVAKASGGRLGYENPRYVPAGARPPVPRSGHRKSESRRRGGGSAQQHRRLRERLRHRRALAPQLLQYDRSRFRGCALAHRAGAALAGTADYPGHQPASLSDAEDFTEGYRSLKLGKVVGEPTAGWIIYTSNVDSSMAHRCGFRTPASPPTRAHPWRCIRGPWIWRWISPWARVTKRGTAS